MLNRVVTARAATINPMIVLMELPANEVPAEEADIEEVVPKVEVVVPVLGSVARVTTASTMPAGTAMTSIALAIVPKFRAQIFHEASIRSLTLSGRSAAAGGTHTGQAPPVWSTMPPACWLIESRPFSRPEGALRVANLPSTVRDDRPGGFLLGGSGRRFLPADTEVVDIEVECTRAL